MTANLLSSYRDKPTFYTLSKAKVLRSTCGITRISELTHLDCIGLPVYAAIRPNAKSIATAQGKGVSIESAMCSAYMEAIEIHYAEELKPDLSCTHYDLPNSFPPSLLMNGFLKYRSPDSTAISWSKGINLLSNEECFIPHDLISLDFTQRRIERNVFQPSSTGLASGNTISEATCHSLYEIIERKYTNPKALDSDMKKLSIDIDTITCDITNVLVKNILKQDLTVRIFYIKNDCNLPVIKCSISDNNSIRGLGVFTGSGAHHCKDIALIRAITEAVQSRLTYISGSRDDIFSLTSIPIKVVDTNNSNISFDEIPSYSIGSTKEMEKKILGILDLQGIKTVFHKTLYSGDLFVVRSFIPGYIS